MLELDDSVGATTECNTGIFSGSGIGNSNGDLEILVRSWLGVRHGAGISSWPDGSSGAGLLLGWA